jgi:hypothetical protein
MAILYEVGIEHAPFWAAVYWSWRIGKEIVARKDTDRKKDCRKLFLF